jgi:hypothetical protein
MKFSAVEIRSELLVPIRSEFVLLPICLTIHHIMSKSVRFLLIPVEALEFPLDVHPWSFCGLINLPRCPPTLRFLPGPTEPISAIAPVFGSLGASLARGQSLSGVGRRSCFSSSLVASDRFGKLGRCYFLVDLFLGFIWRLILSGRSTPADTYHQLILLHHMVWSDSY